MQDGRHVRKAAFDSALRTIAVAVTASALAGPALAAGPFTVNTTADTHDATPGNAVCADSGGQCSLRAAIEEASASGGTTTINLPAGTYALSLGDLIVGTQANTTITLNGAGQSTTIITQTQTGRMVFLVNYNVDSNVVFTLAGVTVKGGSENENDPDGFGGNGGAILAGGTPRGAERLIRRPSSTEGRATHLAAGSRVAGTTVVRGPWSGKDETSTAGRRVYGV